MKKNISNLKLNALPTTPGVYQFYDKTGKILYIGKAKNLRSRVKSYFLRAEELTESRSTAIYQMVQKIKRIKTTSTDSELEA
ncbi:excinuclease ABC subunit C, partial [Candidatus Berkelbacteria bacterium CG23_combo_of_CG06-09_8_20_14_all_41_73]